VLHKSSDSAVTINSGRIGGVIGPQAAGRHDRRQIAARLVVD
jgi:hypothetical protein